jgi:hypothetical protein
MLTKVLYWHSLLIFMLHIQLCCTNYKKVVLVIDTTNYIILYYLALYKYMTSCFEQLHGHTQSIQTHKIKITIDNLILGQNEISDILLHNAY